MELNNIVWDILQGLLVVLAVGVTGFLLAMLAVYYDRAKHAYLALDARLAPFGQTPYGQSVYAGYQRARSQVDQPTDPLIQRMMAFSVLAELQRRNALTPQQLSNGLTYLLDLGGGLFDGQVAAELPNTNELAADLVRALQQDTPPQEANTGQIGGSAH